VTPIHSLGSILLSRRVKGGASWEHAPKIGVLLQKGIVGEAGSVDENKGKNRESHHGLKGGFLLESFPRTLERP